MGRHDSFVNDLAQAIRSHSPMPPFPAGLTLDDAYSLLPKVARMTCDKRVSGIKAGLTKPDMARLLGLESALLGLLYDWGQCELDTILPYRNHSQIECEIAIRLDGQGKPIAIGPAIEIVHLEFSRPEDFNAANLVVCGLGADRYICGAEIPWHQTDFETLRPAIINLFRDGELVLEASPFDSLGGPENAVDWCVQEAFRRNIEITEDAILLTGTCGNALPMTPGEYLADYGPLGRISFEIERAGIT